MSRSLLQGNHTVASSSRSVLNPSTVLGGAVLANDNCVASGFGFTKQQWNMIKTVEGKYTQHLEDQQYEKIPNDLATYLSLYRALTNTRNAYKNNSQISMLITIAMQGITGAINAYGMSARQIELRIQNLYLQDVIDEMLTGVNRNPAFDLNTGGLEALQELELAPLFMYYIKTYGCPQPGDGFDVNKLTVVYNSLISSGIDPGIVNIDSLLPSSTCVTASTVVDLYSKLALYTNSVKTLQDTYAAGDVTAVATILTTDVYDQLSAQINTLAYDLQLSADGTSARALENISQPYRDYEKIRLNTAVGLSSLHQAVRQNTILVDTQNKLEIAQVKVDILLDPVKLKKYIEELNAKAAITALPDQTIGMKAAVVKPQYTEYIKLYGLPSNGAFDPEKLGDIVNQLNGQANPYSSIVREIEQTDAKIKGKLEAQKRLKANQLAQEKMKQTKTKK
jgi:hypothetical protein